MQQNKNVEVLVFKVLSNEVRLAIIASLLKAPMNVNQICEETHKEQTRVSRELRCLAVCGFVYSKRDGKRIIYELNKNTIMPILEAANKHVATFGSKMRGCDMLSDIMKITIK